MSAGGCDLRVPVTRSWIATTALALDVPIVTQDTDVPSIGGPVLRV